MNPNIFSERLRERLYTLRKKQADLVKSLDVSATTVSTWMSGRNFARPELMSRLAQELGTTTSYLYGETEDPSQNTNPTPRAAREDAPQVNQSPALQHHLHHKVQELGERLMDLEGITSWNHLVTHLIKEEGLRQGLFGDLEEIYGKSVTKGERLDFHHSQMDKAKSVFRRAQRVIEDAEREIARLKAGEPEEKIDVDMTKGKD